MGEQGLTKLYFTFPFH